MDIKRINQIFDEIGQFSIDLSDDPTVLGPQYLAKLISTCRNYLNRTAAILLEISRERVATENDLEGEKAAYKIAFDEMLATDDRIKKLPNIRDREAMINTQLTERTHRITALETQLRNLNSIEKAVKVRHNELIRTDGQIKTQRSLIRDEIDTKSYMGDEHDKPRRGSIDEDELQELMGDLPAVREADSPQGNSKSVFTLPEGPEETDVDLGEEVKASVPDLVKEAVAPAPAPEVKAPPPSTPEPIADALAIVASLEALEDTEPVKSAPAPAPEVVDGTEEDAIQSFLKDGPASTSTGKDSKKSKKEKASPKKEEAPVVETLPIEKSTAAEDSDFEDILKNL